MGAAVDEEGREAIAQGRGSIINCEHGAGQLPIPVPVVFAPVGEGTQRITDDAVGPIHLGLGGGVAPQLRYAKPTRMRHEPMPLAKARNTSLVTLGL